ncbi:MAG: nuclease [Gammaproteobacteria bacterium]|nr:MAG: nuclease [Gammaproteobacteria bacterium]
MRLIAAILATLVLANPGFAETINGKVIAIADGDTFTLLTDNKSQVRIRLAEIDAPESGQPYGNESKKALSRLVFGQQIDVTVQTTDRYGRTVGRPYVGGMDVCEEMVRLGAAWVYRDYVIDRGLFDVEKDSKQAKRGLWGLSESQQVEPWNWRRGLGSGGVTPDGCLIKGNINSKGDKIYHVPGMRSYGPTRIDESKGERWFCSEEAAAAAGWRAPRG